MIISLSVVDCESYSSIHSLTDSGISMYPNPSDSYLLLRELTPTQPQLQLKTSTVH